MSDQDNKKRKQPSVLASEPTARGHPLTKDELADAWKDFSHGVDIVEELKNTQSALYELLGKDGPLFIALQSIEERVSRMENAIRAMDKN